MFCRTLCCIRGLSVDNAACAEVPGVIIGKERDADAGGGVGRVDHFPVADVDTNVCNAFAAGGEEYQVAGLKFGLGHFYAVVGILQACASFHFVAVLAVAVVNKTGAVKSLGRRLFTVNITVTYKCLSKVCHLLTYS